MVALIAFCLIVVLTFALIIGLNFAINFLISAGLIWILCWALPLIGITEICNWSIVFSWPLVIVLTTIITILKTVFSVRIDKK